MNPSPQRATPCSSRDCACLWGSLTRTAKVTHVDFESDRPGADPCPVIRLLENLARSLTFLSPLVVKCAE